mmetsp:Transcript_1632/g.5903  ORF Transcript_1632/g.5903 Transcript_1632/m.5903 type:complete len:518 (+) Transcript_1632:35-1588(+)
MAKAALACAAFLASAAHADMGGDLMFGAAAGSSDLGVSESLIAELERELRRDASVLEEWDPLYQLRRLTGSYNFGDVEQQPGFSFGFSYSMSYSMASIPVATEAPTSASPTSFPTKGCSEGEIFAKLFFGPLDNPWEASTVATISVVEESSELTIFEFSDISYYMPICLPAACLKISTTAMPSEDRFVKIQTSADTVAFFGTEFTFCLDETGAFSRTPTGSPTLEPTLAPTLAPSPKPTHVPSPAPSIDVSLVQTLFVVSFPELFSDDAAARFTSGFCLDTAYSLVVDEEVTESYLVESPFISLSYLEGGFSSRAAPDAVVTYSVPAGGTYVEIFTTIEMLPNEIVVRTSLIDTMAKAELKISTLFQKDAVLERTQWNTKIAAKIDPSTCESYDETMAYFRANELEISARYFSSGARRLTDLSELLDVLDETEVLVTLVVTETFAPTLAPSGSVAPSFMPTLTSAPSSTPAPSQAPTTLVCTQSDECPEGFVCCANDPTNRRSLLFGSVYGYCKVSC